MAKHYIGNGQYLSDEEYKEYLNKVSEDPTYAQTLKENMAKKGAYSASENAGNWLKEKGAEIWNGLTGKTSANATIEANKMNIENQNYWNMIAMQREDTAHQREVADLQAAGLNPWLSAGGGAPASALSTAQAEPVDGSKMLQTTSAMALLALTKIISAFATKKYERKLKF